MVKIKISIDKITDDTNFPGWVECSLCDAWGNRYVFNEKIPVVTCSDISLENNFPQIGFIRCELKKEWVDNAGRTILTVNTINPDGVEAVDGKTEFDLLKNQIILCDHFG